MGIEPTRPAWKAGILAIELHPQTTKDMLSQNHPLVNTFLKKFLKTFENSGSFNFFIGYYRLCRC